MSGTTTTSAGTPHGGRILAGATMALVVGNAAISIFSFGVFLPALEAEFGWSRSTLALAPGLCAALSALSLPFVGSLMDRLGVRRVLAWVIPLYALNVAAIGLSETPLAFLLLSALSGAIGAGQGPIGYVQLIVRQFDRHRGIAIGVAMTGVGLGVVAMPQLAAALIATGGWRIAYLGLGIAVVLVAMPAWLLLRPADRGARAPVVAADDVVAERTGLRHLLNGRAVWLMAVAALAMSCVLNGVLVHVVALLGDRGWTPAAAAAALIPAGIATMVGRLLAGGLLDLIFAPWVATGFFVMALAGLALLATGHSVTIGLIGIGLATGAEIDVIGYMVSRYVPAGSFGRLYGLLFAVFTVGAGLGPYLMGVAYERSHGYDLAFAVSGGAIVVAIAAMLALPRYPD